MIFFQIWFYSQGTEQWKENVEAIAKYEGKPKDLGPDWEWDGFRRCQVKAARDESGKLMGEGIMAYENKDVWKGVFDDGIMNRTGTLQRSQMNGTNDHGTGNGTKFKRHRRADITNWRMTA